MTARQDELVKMIKEIRQNTSLTIEDFDTNLEDLGFDSLDTMTLLMDVEEKYSIKFSVEEANELSTVNQFLASIESKKSGPGAET